MPVSVMRALRYVARINLRTRHKSWKTLRRLWLEFRRSWMSFLLGTAFAPFATFLTTTPNLKPIVCFCLTDTFESNVEVLVFPTPLPFQGYPVAKGVESLGRSRPRLFNKAAQVALVVGGNNAVCWPAVGREACKRLLTAKARCRLPLRKISNKKPDEMANTCFLLSNCRSIY